MAARTPDREPALTLRNATTPRLEAGGNTGLFAVVVGQDAAGQRLDKALASAVGVAGFALSRTRLQALIEDGCVTLDGRTTIEPKTKLSTGQRIALTVPPPRAAEPDGQSMPLAIAYEDEHLLVLDKPAGLVVHPAAGHEDGTLVNALIAHCEDGLSGIGGVRRPGIVHRLDKGTSGLMVVAKTDAAHSGLSAIFADHGRSGSLVREYHAFVWGAPAQSEGKVEAALARDPHNRMRMAIVAANKGRRAITHWSVLRHFGDAATILRCRLETGRTHQIRVHLASLGHPVIGDPVYGTGFRTKAARLGGAARVASQDLRRQALHAATLGFAHPVTREPLLLQSALPSDLLTLEEALSADAGPG